MGDKEMSSDWLKRESDEFASQRSTEEERRQLIAKSNYWHEILDRLRQDIEFLNTESPWARRLQDTPITIKPFGQNYRIEKHSLPTVIAIVGNGLDAIDISFTVVGFDFEEKKAWREEWNVDTDGDLVRLTRAKRSLVVPEQVSQHILRPFVDELKKKIS